MSTGDVRDRWQSAVGDWMADTTIRALLAPSSRLQASSSHADSRPLARPPSERSAR